MQHFFLLVLIFLLPTFNTWAEGGSGTDDLLHRAAQLRLEQVRLKDLTLRINETVLGASENLTRVESVSLERVNQRLVTVAMVASYEASRLEMLSYMEAAHRPRFAEALAEELEATTRALSLDEQMIRDSIRNWSPVLRDQLGVPEDILAGVRLSFGAAIGALKKLSGKTI